MQFSIVLNKELKSIKFYRSFEICCNLIRKLTFSIITLCEITFSKENSSLSFSYVFTWFACVAVIRVYADAVAVLCFISIFILALFLGNFLTSIELTIGLLLAIIWIVFNTIYQFFEWIFRRSCIP